MCILVKNFDPCNVHQLEQRISELLIQDGYDVSLNEPRDYDVDEGVCVSTSIVRTTKTTNGYLEKLGFIRNDNGGLLKSVAIQIINLRQKIYEYLIGVLTDKELFYLCETENEKLLALALMSSEYEYLEDGETSADIFGRCGINFTIPDKEFNRS